MTKGRFWDVPKMFIDLHHSSLASYPLSGSSSRRHRRSTCTSAQPPPSPWSSSAPSRTAHSSRAATLRGPIQFNCLTYIFTARLQSTHGLIITFQVVRTLIPMQNSCLNFCIWIGTQGVEAPFFEFTPSGYWDYADPDADWGGDCMTGSNQSPIDITSGTMVTYTGLTFTSYGTTQSGLYPFSFLQIHYQVT